ncbi:MAG: ArgP/LysG family DNA-binding transcriptional regulator [Marinovum sp.]|nr:ArgP/LysG family DNA-binding transcriptional regulator [Marinovum sp.]
MHLDPAQLAALLAILRSGSFDAAAAALNVTPPAISQRIRALEERLGASLVTRTAPITATDVGRRIAQHAETLAVLETNLARTLQLDAPDAQIRVAVNADSLDTWFLPALCNVPFLVDAVVVDQSRTLDLLRRGEVVAAITDTATPAQGARVIPLGALRYCPSASPKFVERWFPHGLTKDAAAQAPMLQFSRDDPLQHQWINQRFGPGVRPPTRLLPSTHGFVTACRLGQAWGFNPLPLVEDDLKTGRLLRLDDLDLDTPLFWQISRLLVAALQPLTRAIRKAARASLIPPTRLAQ